MRTGKDYTQKTVNYRFYSRYCNRVVGDPDLFRTIGHVGELISDRLRSRVRPFARSLFGNESVDSGLYEFPIQKPIAGRVIE